MGMRLVSGGGVITEPAVQMMYGSGVIHADSVVIYDAATGVVSPAASTSTATNIIGVSLDYAQGASDVQVRVIPFVEGQLWEVDCVNAAATSNILLRHQLASNLLVRNVTSVSESATTGVFLAYNVVGSTSGSGKLVGTFLRHPGVRRGGAYDIL